MKKGLLLCLLISSLYAKSEIATLLETYQSNPSDITPLTKIVTAYRMEGKHHLAYMFAKMGMLKSDDYRFQQELSICAYYAGHKEDGYIASSNLVLQKGVPWNYKNQTYCNLRFYAEPLKNARYIPISPVLDEHYHPMNPSIQRTERGFDVICRGVNYIQEGAIHFVTVDPDQIFRSKSYLMEYDRNFLPLSQTEIVENLPRTRFPTHVQGIEDGRLFAWKGENWFTCSLRDTDSTGLPKVVLCKLEKGEVKRFIPLIGPDFERCERNWLPLIKNDELYLVYLCNPFTLFKPNLETGECETVLEYVTYNYDFSQFRGSAAPIAFDDGYLMLIHEIAYDGRGARTYFHRFVYLNKDLMIKSLSKPFFFRHLGIEFCSSMTLNHAGTELVMSMGSEDNEAFFCIVDIPEVRLLLEPIELETNYVENRMIGFGTYPLTGKVCTDAVKSAIRAGYRMIDTATFYRNFDAISKAIQDEDRSSLYIISKVWHDKQRPKDLKADLEKTLSELKVDYIDAYFLHWPNSEISIEETLHAMDALRKEKKIKHIGLSNVNVNHLKRALEVGVPITWVQVEMHPHFLDKELLEFCKKHSIAVQAWGPLGRGRLADDVLLTTIGKKYGKSASQVALRWIIQHGAVPLPGSSSKKHIEENIAALDFVLSKDDMHSIDEAAKAGQRERYAKTDIGFGDEFDYTYEECWPNKGE